jgi:hypothetical protein
MVSQQQTRYSAARREQPTNPGEPFVKITGRTPQPTNLKQSQGMTGDNSGHGVKARYPSKTDDPGLESFRWGVSAV